MIDPQRVGFDEAARNVLTRMKRRAVAVRRSLRVAGMACLAVVMRTVARRSLNGHRRVLTEMVHAAAQNGMRRKYQARQHVAKFLHGKARSCPRSDSSTTILFSTALRCGSIRALPVL
jgi:hypothetical protein